MTFRSLLLGAALSAGLFGAAHAQLVIGSPGSPGHGNCYPFGCTALNVTYPWGPDYQQVYNANDFSGPITITSLTFYNHNFILAGGSSPVDTGTFQISLSTTSAPVNGLDFNTLTNNVGADNTQVYDGSLPGLSGPGGVGGQMIIQLTTPFTYDPGQGNLLMDVQSTDATINGPLFGAYLDAYNGDAPGDIFSRTYSTSGGVFDVNWGLVTGFNAVPEPATWAMMLLGLGGLGAAMRSRRKAASAAA